MVKKYGTSKAEEADARMLSGKASDYRSAIEASHSEGLWDPAVSNGIHALLPVANAVTSQIKREYYTGQDHDGAAGSEVDLIVQPEGKLVPIEVKLSATPGPAMVGSMKRFREDLPGHAMRGYAVHPGDVRLPLGKGVTALPFAEL